MEVTENMAREAYDDLGPVEQQTLVNILGGLQQHYIMYISNTPNAVDLPYFFWSTNQQSFFEGVLFNDAFPEDGDAKDFVRNSMYYVSIFLKARRQS